MAKKNVAKRTPPMDDPIPSWGLGEGDVIGDVRSQVYAFLKQGVVSGKTCDYSPELDKLRSDTIRLFGSNGKSFTLTISR